MKPYRQNLFKAAINADAVRMLNVILIDAYYKDILEIHFVPKRLKLDVFYVVAKTATLFRTLPQGVKDGILARIKLMAGLDIAEREEIKDASFDFDFDPKVVITFSVAIIPVRFGEKIILKPQR